MKWLAAVLAVIAPAIATTAQATAQVYTENNKAIAHVGVQGTQAYVTFVVAPTASCAYNNVYLDVTTDDGKADLSVLLTARASNIPISRIDYAITAGVCTVVLVEM